MTHSIIDFFLSVLPTFVGLTGSLLVFIVHQNSPRASLYTEYIQERKREKKKYSNSRVVWRGRVTITHPIKEGRKEINERNIENRM
jgi:hypothetical protein